MPGAPLPPYLILLEINALSPLMAKRHVYLYFNSLDSIKV